MTGYIHMAPARADTIHVGRMETTSTIRLARILITHGLQEIDTNVSVVVLEFAIISTITDFVIANARVGQSCRTENFGFSMIFPKLQN